MVSFYDENKNQIWYEPYYGEFLESDFWKCVAEYVKYRADYECEMCGEKGDLHAHHIHYQRRFNHRAGYWETDYEEIYQRDVICLCAECHSQIHKKGFRTKCLNCGERYPRTKSRHIGFCDDCYERWAYRELEMNDIDPYEWIIRPARRLERDKRICKIVRQKMDTERIKHLSDDVSFDAPAEPPFDM